MPATLEGIRSRLSGAAAPPPVSLDSLRARLSIPAPVAPQMGRLRSAGGAGVQGGVDVVAGVPKGLAINRGAALETLNKAFDAIDRGERPDLSEIPMFAAVELGSYRSSSPEKRQAIRQRYAREDPRESRLFKAGEALSAATRETFPVDPAYRDEFWAQKLPSGIGSTIGFGVAGALTRGAGMGGLAGAAVTGALTQEASQFEDAIRHGASLEDAYEAANLGALVGTIEGLPIARVLARFDKGTGGSVKRVILSGLKGGTEEGAQEAAQSIASNLIASGIVKYDPDRGLLTGTGADAGVGFSVGALFSVVASMIGGRRRRGPQAPAETPTPPSATAAPETAPAALTTQPEPVAASVEPASEAAPTVESLQERAAAVPTPTAPVEAQLDPIVRMSEFEQAAPVASLPTAESLKARIEPTPVVEAGPTYEPTAIGEQAVIPGTERITQAQQAQRGVEVPLKAKAAQASPTEGLFDVAGRGQFDLIEQARKAPKTKATAAATKGPTDLLEFLRESGGMRDDGGELQAMDAHKEHIGKAFQKRLVRDGGLSLDSAREAAAEAGYLSPNTTVADFLDVVSENLQGRPVYSAADVTEVQEREPFEGDPLADDPHERAYAEYMASTEETFLHAGIAWPYSKQIWDIISKPFERFAPLGKLPEKKRYLLARYLTLGRLDAIERKARKVGLVFRKATKADKAAAYEYLTNRESSADMIEAPEVSTAAIGAKKAIENLGRRLVSAGLISRESFEANRGQYLPRVYLKYLLPEGAAFVEGGGARPKPSTLAYTKARKDIPRDIRELVLGEVKDPAYLAAKAMAIPARDLELLDFLGKISQDADWVFPDTMVEWRGKQVTAYWLKSEATRVRNDIVPRLATEQRDAALVIAGQMDAIANPPIKEMGGKVPADYKQIPDTTRYGMLRGMWVRKEIHDDVMGAAGMGVSPDASTAERWLGYGGVATKATQLWKLSKVALNPPTQVRNFVSNGILLHLSGVPFSRVYGPNNVIVQAINDIRKDGQYWNIAQKYGVAKSTFSATEISGLRREVIRLQAEKQGPLGHMKRVAHAVADAASDVYGMSEAIFKTAKIMDAMKREGLSEGDAALAAQEALFDYSLVPRSVGYLRNAPLGIPFITFYYKAFPRMIEAAVKRPGKFAPYIALPMIMHAMIANEYDVEADDVEKLRKALPTWLRERGNAWILPFKDKVGRWQAIDVGYFLPWSMYLEVGKAAGRGKPAEVLKAAGATSSPLGQINSAVTTGIDPFTEREIANSADPPAKQVADIMRFVWRLAMPTWITDIGAANRLHQAIQGKTDYYGDPGYTVWQAIPRFVGVNVYPIEPAVSRRRNIVRMRREIDDIRGRMRGVLRDKRLNADQKKSQREDYQAHMRRAQDALKRYMDESRIHPSLR